MVYLLVVAEEEEEKTVEIREVGVMVAGTQEVGVVIEGIQETGVMIKGIQEVERNQMTKKPDVALLVHHVAVPRKRNMTSENVHQNLDKKKTQGVVLVVHHVAVPPKRNMKSGDVHQRLDTKTKHTIGMKKNILKNPTKNLAKARLKNVQCHGSARQAVLHAVDHPRKGKAHAMEETIPRRIIPTMSRAVGVVHHAVVLLEAKKGLGVKENVHQKIDLITGRMNENLMIRIRERILS